MKTIGEVVREENAAENAACLAQDMGRCGTLRDWPKMYGDRYIWLGGFKRFAQIASVTADWWVHERQQWDGGPSWCCTPDTPVYRRHDSTDDAP